jgi:membrane protein required for colicin V production
MIEAQLTYFDAAVIGIMALSCMFAFFRGFVKEVLSLGAWIGAGIITLYYFRDVAALIKPHVKTDMVAGGLATLGLYIVSLLGFSIINSLIVRMMKEGGDIGILDNSLGLLFGAFRGAFIISLGYFMMMTVMTEDNAPTWLKHAQTKQYAEKGAIILGRAAPDYLVELTSLKDKILENKESGQSIVDLVRSDENGNIDSSSENQNIDNFMNRMKEENQQ